MLCRHHNGLNTLRIAVIVVFYCNLALGIGSQIGHHMPLFAYAGQFLQEDMSKRDRQRHKFRGFVAGISKHHALVTCALFFGGGASNALVNVRTLPMDGRQHSTRIGFKHILAFRVANTTNHIAHGVLNLDIPVACHFAAYHHQTGGN